jgi:methyl-accepting chemotaxis protein WspA
MGQQLSNIIARVESLAPRFEDINQGMLAQSVGAEQITQAMAQFNDGMQQTAESLRGWRQTVELLTDAAHALRGGVEQFKIA